MKNFVFCDITLCSSVEVNRCFGGTYRLHLQGRKVSQESKQNEVRRILLHGVESQKQTSSCI
jgi:hypothetical protein